MPSAVNERRLTVVNRRRVCAWAGTLLVVACGGRATTPDDGNTTNFTGGDGDGDSITDTSDSATGGEDGAGTGGAPSDHEVDPDLVVGSCGYANACKCDSNRRCEEYLQPTKEELARHACTSPLLPLPAGVGGTWLDVSYDYLWDAVPCPRTRVIARCLWSNGTRAEYYYEGGPEENLLDGFESDCPGEFIRE